MSENRKENRKQYRMGINLEGSYWKNSSTGALGKLEKTIVVNLSAGGCLIHVSDGHDLNRNDNITLMFRLDNPERTKIQKDAIVRRVIENYIGCKFSSEYNKDIWFYVHEHISPK